MTLIICTLSRELGWMIIPTDLCEFKEESPVVHLPAIGGGRGIIREIHLNKQQSSTDMNMIIIVAIVMLKVECFGIFRQQFTLAVLSKNQ